MKKFKLICFLVLFGLSSLSSTEYQVDTKNSLVSFKIRHAVIAKVEGKFNNFSAHYEYDDTLNYFKSFEAKVEVASIDTDDTYRDDHLRSKVFDVTTYPSMEVKLLKQSGTSFNVELKIKDISKEIDFEIFLAPEKEKSFLLMGKISRKDFNLKFSDTAELGGLAVGDEVEINILFSAI